VIDSFLAENPQVTIEFILSDGHVNIVDEGIDIAIRFGNLADSSLRVRSLGENKRVVCASPEYINRYGKPRVPSDLENHNCLLMRFGAQLDNVWHFHEDDKGLQVLVKGNRIANDGRLVHDWCLDGYGIALKSWWDVGLDIKSGALLELLDKYYPPATSIQMLFPPSRSQPLRVKEFSKKIAKAFGK
jgi:DNA-binding transcriptional LysR family regulator